MKYLKGLVLSACLVVLSFVGSVHAEDQYTMRNLGLFPGDNYGACQGINNSGQVTGVSANSGMGAGSRAFIWDKDSGMQSLGTLGSNDSCGMGVNSSGQVAGYSNTSAGYTHPFLWDKVDGMRDLGTLEGREDAVYYAYAINDPGQVVGGASGVAFRWDNENGMRTVGSLIDARDVNNSGQIAGSYYMGGQHAVLWDEVSGERDLGTLGGASTASGLNDMGQVVGYSLISGGGWGSPTIYHAFLWDEVNGMQDIGTLGGAQSVAQGINNLGQVVGYSTTPDGVYHAFVWDSVNGMQNLTPENGGFAFAINDLGTIVGEAYFDGALKPTIWEAPAAPEPVSSALFIIGGGALAAMRRRKK